MVEMESDLLFRAAVHGSPGEEAFVYVLWEHQRHPDSWMPFRVWRYVAAVYRELIREKKDLQSGNKLPFVYPVVLYQGEEAWDSRHSLEELIDTGKRAA